VGHEFEYGFEVFVNFLCNTTSNPYSSSDYDDPRFKSFLPSSVVEEDTNGDGIVVLSRNRCWGMSDQRKRKTPSSPYVTRN